MKRKIFILFVNIIIFLWIFPSTISFWATNNIFKSYDKENDFGFSYEYNYLKTDINNEIEYNSYYYLPFVNYLLFQTNQSLNYYLYSIDNYSNILTHVFYADLYLYISDYFESNMFSPGYYIYYKHYWENSMMKLSNDIYPNFYPFIPEINNIKAKQLYKYLFYFKGINYHLNLYTADKYFYKEQKNAYYFAIKPSISFNIKETIGFNISYLYKKSYGDSLPYYYDDSFIDEFYYNNNDFSISINILKNNIKFNIKYNYSEKTFLNVIDIESIDYYSIYGITFSNVNRRDENNSISLGYEVKKNNYNIGVVYEYEKNISTNAFYNYSEHSFSITYKY